MLSQCHGTNGWTSSFRILEKVDFDAYVLVRRWMFSTTLDKRVSFKELFSSVNFGLTLAWHAPQHSAVAGYTRTWKLTTKVEKEKHASPSFRTTCFMYLTPACDRPTDGREDQQNEDTEGVAALLKA